MFDNRRPRVTVLSVAMGTKYIYFAAGGERTDSAPLIYDLNVHWAVTNLDGGLRTAPDPRGHLPPAFSLDVAGVAIPVEVRA